MDKKYTKESNFEILDIDDNNVILALSKSEFDRIVETPRIETIQDVSQAFDPDATEAQSVGILIVFASVEHVNGSRDEFLKAIEKLYADNENPEEKLEFAFPHSFGKDMLDAIKLAHENLNLLENVIGHNRKLLDTYKTVNNY